MLQYDEVVTDDPATEAKIQRLQPRQILQVIDFEIRNPSAEFQGQSSQRRERPEVLPSGIGDRSFVEIQRGEIRQTFQGRQIVICDLPGLK